MKLITVDGSTFNAEHFEGWSEADFIKDQLPSVPVNYGDGKIDFLKKVFELINPAEAGEKAAVKKGK